MPFYHTVLWDWNGTLLNDVALCVNLLNTMLARYGLAPVSGTQQYRSIFGFPIEAYYERAGFDFTKVSYPALADEYMKLYIPQSFSCPLQSDARSVLSALHSAGVQQVILSASEKKILEQHVAYHNLNAYFDELLGLSDIYAKSKAEIGLAWMQKSGCDPLRTVMVGDSVHDFEVAKAMGVSCVLFSGGHQSQEALRQTGAAVIDSLSGLTALLQQKL